MFRFLVPKLISQVCCAISFLLFSRTGPGCIELVTRTGILHHGYQPEPFRALQLVCRDRSRKILDIANFLSESVFEIRKTEVRFLPDLGNENLAHSTVFHFLGFDSEACDRLADLVIFRFCLYIQCPTINLEILHQTAQFLELNSQ